MKTDSFEQKLQQGRTGETALSFWLRQQGWSLLSVYEVPLDAGKGPRLYAALDSGHDKLIAPDILVMKQEKLRWVEAKTKTKFAYFGRNRAWQTGIDERHYQHYLHVREITGIPLWLMFLHWSATPSADDLAWGSPKECPTGLFGHEIFYLDKRKAQPLGWGYSTGQRHYSMVYWKHETLIQFATLEEIVAAQPQIIQQDDDVSFDNNIEICW